MIGAGDALGLAAAAAEQVHAAQGRVGALIDDVEGVAWRLRGSAEIPWTGDAARAWRDRVQGTGRDLARAVEELGELQALLGALLQRVRP